MSQRTELDQDRIAALLGTRRVGPVRAEGGPFGATQTARDVLEARARDAVHLGSALLVRLDALAASTHMSREQLLGRVLERALDELESSPESRKRLLRSA